MNRKIEGSVIKKTSCHIIALCMSFILFISFFGMSLLFVLEKGLLKEESIWQSMKATNYAEQAQEAFLEETNKMCFILGLSPEQVLEDAKTAPFKEDLQSVVLHLYQEEIPPMQIAVEQKFVTDIYQRYVQPGLFMTLREGVLFMQKYLSLFLFVCGGAALVSLMTIGLLFRKKKWMLTYTSYGCLACGGLCFMLYYAIVGYIAEKKLLVQPVYLYDTLVVYMRQSIGLIWKTGILWLVLGTCLCLFALLLPAAKTRKRVTKENGKS